MFASRILTTLVLLIVTGLSLPHSGQGAELPPGEPLRLAMSGAFQPFSTTDRQGRLVGFDADIARAIAREMGRQPVLVQTDWAGIQAGLQAGKYDLICGSMAITPERVAAMHFSLPYYVSGAQVFARDNLASLAGQRIGVTENSTYAGYIADHPERFPAATVVPYGSEAEIVTAVNTGKIDAFISDRIVGGFYLKKNATGGIVPYGNLLYRETVGIAAPLSRPRLIHQVNGALLALIQTAPTSGCTASGSAWNRTWPCSLPPGANMQTKFRR